MQDVEQGVERRRGRPRSKSAHRAILDAARELLTEQDLVHLNLEQIAAQAGVGKGTIYRHWRTREALALELLLELAGEIRPVRDRGDVRAELIAMVEGTVRVLTRTPLGRVMEHLFSELALNPALSDPFRAAIVQARRAAVAAVMSRGIERNQIRSDADLDLATELLMGPIYYRLLFGGEFSPDFSTRLVDVVLTGLGRR